MCSCGGKFRPGVLVRSLVLMDGEYYPVISVNHDRTACFVTYICMCQSCLDGDPKGVECSEDSNTLDMKSGKLDLFG